MQQKACIAFFKDIWKAVHLLCQKYTAETLLCSDKRILEIWIISTHPNVTVLSVHQLRNAAQGTSLVHFIIIISDDSLKWQEILVLLWMRTMSFLLPSTFHLHYFSSACHSIWKKLWEQIHCLHRRLYHDRFSDSINHIYTSNSLRKPKKPSTDLLQFRLTRLLVASHFHSCSCQVYHRAIKRPWQF